MSGIIQVSKGRLKMQMAPIVVVGLLNILKEKMLKTLDEGFAIRHSIPQHRHKVKIVYLSQRDDIFLKDVISLALCVIIYVHLFLLGINIEGYINFPSISIVSISFINLPVSVSATIIF